MLTTIISVALGAASILFPSVPSITSQSQPDGVADCLIGDLGQPEKGEGSEQPEPIEE
jgi:hypothetical protein